MALLDAKEFQFGRQNVFATTVGSTDLPSTNPNGIYQLGDTILNLSGTVGQPCQWVCSSAGTTPTWSPSAGLIMGAVPTNAPTGAIGVESAGILTQFGGAAFGSIFGSFAEEGNIYRNVGNPIAGNAANTSDNILDGFVLPAGAFDQAKRGIIITAQGMLGSTANNKRVRIWLNPTMSGQTTTNGVISGGTVSGAGSGVLLFDSGAQTGNGVGFSMYGNLFKYGAANSNTQYFQGSPIFGTTHGGITVASFPTITENAAINIVVTGASQTTGAASDVVLNWTEVNAMN